MGNGEWGDKGAEGQGSRGRKTLEFCSLPLFSTRGYALSVAMPNAQCPMPNAQCPINLLPCG
ncbi:MAG: hypothetical protein ACRAVC_12315 [Trichormus sp.]